MSAPTIAPSTAQIMANPGAYQPPQPAPWQFFVGRAVEHNAGQAPGYYPWAEVHTLILNAPDADQDRTWALERLGPPRHHDQWHIEWTEVTPCRH